MTDVLQPSTERIRTLVVAEIADRGGTASDCFDDGRRLFLRTVLPTVREVRPKDGVHGGVAVMVIDEDIRVCPYVFRKVCRNGAIMSQVTQVQQLRRRPVYDPAVEQELQEAVRTCCSADALAGAVGQMQSAAARDANRIVTLLPLLAHASTNVVTLILERFKRDGDPSAFGLMNAVTSVARDETDPRTRWRLEELGGSIPALVPPAPGRGTAAAEPGTGREMARLVGAART